MRTTLLLASMILSLSVTGCDDSGVAGDAGGGLDAAPARDGGDITPDGGDTTPDGGEATPDGGDATPDGGDTTPDGGDTTLDGGEASCELTSTLERGCGADENCVVGVHQTDCCGNTVAIGMNHSERDRFDAAEAACRETYPACGCPSGPTTTDSGETVFDASAIQVGCIARSGGSVCMTYVEIRPSDTP